MIYINLGKKIKEQRVSKGYTQEQLGEKIDSTGSYIGQIERGEKNASMEKIIKIAENLDVSIDYLVGNNVSNEIKSINENLAEELKTTTYKQKEMAIDIIKIIKKYK